MLSLLFGGASSLAVYYWRTPIDAWILRKARALLTRSRSEEEWALPWLQHLIRTVRSGHPLTHGLETFPTDNAQNPYSMESKKILAAQAVPNPMSRFIAESIRGGAPVLSSLQFFHRRLEQRIRGKRRANALTAQARLQALVIFFAPWGLLATLSAADPEMAQQALHDPICQLVWLIALLMSVGGFLWIQRILQGALLPKTTTALLNDDLLPQFLLHTYARVLSGTPIEAAARDSVPEKSSLEFHEAFTDIFAKSKPDTCALILEIKDMLCAAARQGFPLREEIERALADCESFREAYIEEAIQKLPIKILAPLFLCILPAALMILFSFIYPVLNQWI